MSKASVTHPHRLSQMDAHSQAIKCRTRQQRSLKRYQFSMTALSITTTEVTAVVARGVVGEVVSQQLRPKHRPTLNKSLKDPQFRRESPHIFTDAHPRHQKLQLKFIFHQSSQFPGPC